MKSNLSLYSQYYAKACNKLAGSVSASLGAEQHGFFCRNVAAVASRWQHFVPFDGFEIWTSDLSH